jgi:GWxTD domain-containing protein
VRLTLLFLLLLLLAPQLAAQATDSGVVLLDRATMLHAEGRDGDARDALLAGAAHGGNAAGALAYRTFLSLVATPDELADWDATPVADRAKWLRRFWLARDLMAGVGEWERLDEHFRRLALARRSYARDTRGAPVGRLDEVQDEFRMPVPFDDRGRIYVRHGEPDDRLLSFAGQAYEVWRYRRANGDLVLFFREDDLDGAVGAGTLVDLPGLTPVQIEQLCGARRGICDELERFGAPDVPMRPEIGALRRSPTPEVVQRVRERGQAHAIAALTTDSYRPSFDRELPITAQLYGLHSPEGVPLLLLAFAIPTASLPAQTVGTEHRVTIRIGALAYGDDSRVTRDTTLVLRTARRGASFIGAAVTLPLAPGTYSVAARFTDADSGGALATLDPVRIPSRVGLQVSDPILGVAQSGLAWWSGTDSVPLNPLGAVARGGSLELYYQVMGMRPGVGYETRYELLHADAEASEPALVIAERAEATEPAAAVMRTLDLSTVPAGRYRVRVVVRGGGLAATGLGFLTVR